MDNCPHCGAELSFIDDSLGGNIHWSCGSFLHKASDDIRRSHSCRIRELEQEVKMLGAANRSAVESCRRHSKEDIERIGELEKVLEFYAERRNYFTTSKGFVAQYDPADTKIDLDKGNKAREVLGLPVTVERGKG